LAAGQEIFDLPKIPEELDRTVVKKPISTAGDLFLYLTHLGRKLTEGAETSLSTQSDRCLLYINTGRPAVRWMTELTQRSLKQTNIDRYFEGIYYKPSLVDSLTSKASALYDLYQEYDFVSHVDDNPATVLPLADIFKGIQFYLVNDKSTNFLLSKFKRQIPRNVIRVSKLSEISKA
jgi:hypothetical protein